MIYCFSHLPLLVWLFRGAAGSRCEWMLVDVSGTLTLRFASTRCSHNNWPRIARSTCGHEHMSGRLSPNRIQVARRTMRRNICGKGRQTNTVRLIIFHSIHFQSCFLLFGLHHTVPQAVSRQEEKEGLCSIGDVERKEGERWWEEGGSWWSESRNVLGRCKRQSIYRERSIRKSRCRWEGGSFL